MIDRPACPICAKRVWWIMRAAGCCLGPIRSTSGRQGIMLDMDHAVAKTMTQGQPGVSVFEDINEADDQAKSLHDLIGQLAGKLAPILTPLDSPPAEQISEVRSPRSDVRVRLGDHASLIRDARHRLEQLFERIEL